MLLKSSSPCGCRVRWLEEAATWWRRNTSYQTSCIHPTAKVPFEKLSPEGAGVRRVASQTTPIASGQPWSLPCPSGPPTLQFRFSGRQMKGQEIA